MADHPPGSPLDVGAIGWTQPQPSVARDPADLVVDAVLDAEAYRAIAQQAIHALHTLQAAHDRQREAYHRLLDEMRATRAREAA